MWRRCSNCCQRFRRQRIPSEARLFQISAALAAAPRNGLRNPAAWNALLLSALVDECGKRALLPIGLYASNAAPTSTDEDTSDASVVVKRFRGDLLPPRYVPVARELVVAGDLAAFAAVIGGVPKEWVIDPHRGRLLWVGGGAAPQPLVSYHYGFSGGIGAGGYNRSASLTRAVTRIIRDGGAIQTSAPANPNFLPAGGANGETVEVLDSATYTPIDNRDQITNLELRAANRERAYLRLTHNWLLDTSANLDSLLVLDGLWVGADAAFSIQLRGDYGEVVLRHMTLDPGGVDAGGNPIRPVPLSVRGNVGRLVIEDSITGRIAVEGAGNIETLEIRDSIVDGRVSAAPAISVPFGRVIMRRVTVFGEVAVESLDASEALITGLATVVDTQEGCFRFSAVLERADPLNPASAHSRVPHPYESHFIRDFNAVFTSRVFGQPGFAQLAESAPLALLRGAENGSEIGAFSGLLNPIELDSLRAKIDEFAPFGLLPVYLFET
jgi:hypothetical protein